MTKDMLISRRAVIASGIALGVSSFAPRARAAAPLKVAGIHASPVENAWNSCLHKALQDAAKDGVIEYVSPKVSPAPIIRVPCANMPNRATS